ncbi:hypothetical protein IDJ75_06575 [Mucilaginibacter rigui]|uniref:Uncharacterized protein n=1 Tax=Mucilaginibacter rigui TaxID=534635 RepID=A0ABR7X2Y0_9SPHI|nr:DUF6326 family protein [Mucilaginibacter rigui]MBD1384936.1 hypothetical protein [Mucilaginibacter rigui]
MAPNGTITRSFEDIKVNTKIKLSALWVSLMLLYIYGDIFSMFVPQRLKGLLNGHMGVGETTPYKLLAAAILMAVPALMVFLSLVLKPKTNRILNIIAGIIYTIVMVLVVLISIDPWWVFYIFLGMVEVIITLLIVWQAWKWPKTLV